MKKLIVIAALALCAAAGYGQQQKLVVAPFENRGAKLDAAALNNLQDFMIDSINNTERFQAPDRSALNLLAAEQKFQRSDWADGTKSAQMGKALSANYIVQVLAVYLGDDNLLIALVQDVKTANILAAAELDFSTQWDALRRMDDFVEEILERIDGGRAGGTGRGGPAQAATLGGVLVPGFVNESYRNASEDVLVGIGAYKIGNNPALIAQGKTMAEVRARADIARQMNTIVKNMVNDYTAAASGITEVAAISFQENISQALAKVELKDTRTVKLDTDNGVLWVVIEYSKAAVAKDFNAAQSAAKLAVPAARAFDALVRMDAAFNKTAGGGPVPAVE